MEKRFERVWMGVCGVDWYDGVAIWSDVGVRCVYGDEICTSTKHPIS